MPPAVQTPPDFKQHAYILISLILGIPLLLWPLLWQMGFSPKFGENPQHQWHIAASSLLIAAVVADSALTRINSYQQLLYHAFWILAAVASASLAMKMTSGAYMLAMIFALHSLRSAYPIWLNRHQWWHKIAWLRDVLTSSILFYWFSHWPL